MRLHLVDDARVRGDDLDVVLAADALLDDFHVQQAEEAAAETEAERERAFRGINERRVVEPQAAEGGLELFVVVGLERIEAAEHHRAHFLVARQHLRRRLARERDGVAGLDVGRCS